MTWGGQLGFQSQPATPINVTIPDLAWEGVFDYNGAAGIDGPQGIMGYASLSEVDYRSC